MLSGFREDIQTMANKSNVPAVVPALSVLPPPSIVTGPAAATPAVAPATTPAPAAPAATTLPAPAATAPAAAPAEDTVMPATCPVPLVDGKCPQG